MLDALLQCASGQLGPLKSEQKRRDRSRRSNIHDLSLNASLALNPTAYIIYRAP